MYISTPTYINCIHFEFCTPSCGKTKNCTVKELEDGQTQNDSAKADPTKWSYGGFQSLIVFHYAFFLTKPNEFLLKTSTLFHCRYLRAVAYRWLIRWLCGYMGWGNTRPLPACIYHEIRTKFESHKPLDMQLPWKEVKFHCLK